MSVVSACMKVYIAVFYPIRIMSMYYLWCSLFCVEFRCSLVTIAGPSGRAV